MTRVCANEFPQRSQNVWKGHPRRDAPQQRYRQGNETKHISRMFSSLILSVCPFLLLSLSLFSNRKYCEMSHLKYALRKRRWNLFFYLSFVLAPIRLVPLDFLLTTFISLVSPHTKKICVHSDQTKSHRSFSTLQYNTRQYVQFETFNQILFTLHFPKRIITRSLFFKARNL